jgi:four helix bundle protein
MGNFRTLEAWRQGDALLRDLYREFERTRSRAYPGLRDQILRAAGAIVDNLAEGCARRSRLELARYADMAYASAKEVESQLERARYSKALTEQQYAEFALRVDHVARLCYGLARPKR